MQTIDTHAHFHDPLKTHDLLWPSPEAPYHRTCLPQNYRDEIETRPVIAVETSPRRKDDLRLQELAATDNLIAGYVSNLQPLEAGFEARLAEAIKDPKWCGLRLRPIAAFDLASKPLIAALDRLDGRGHVELGLIEPERLIAFCELCLALPHIRFVLTHSGHPVLADDASRFDYKLLKNIENIYVKISPPQQQNMADQTVRDRLSCHVRKLVDHLSTDRLMFGSNWPVTPEPERFENWLTRTLEDAHVAANQVLSGTAQSLYRPTTSSNSETKQNA